MDEQGTTLLELIIAVVMIASVVIMIALFIPKASATITNNRQHTLAVNFATSRLQELKEQPYALIPTTAPGTPGVYFPSTSVGAGGCDCTAVINWALLPKPDWGGSVGPDATFTEDGVPYTRQVCINLVSPGAVGVWNPQCMDSANANNNDTGLKNIRVRVSWNANGNTYFTEAESKVIR